MTKLSESLFAISLSLLFIVVVSLIFAVNKKLKSKMLILEKIAVITLIPTILVTVFWGVTSSLNEKRFKDNKLYMAYKYLELGNYSEALKRSERLLDLNPKDVQVVQLNALAKLLSGQVKDAETLLSAFEMENDLSDREQVILNDVEALVKVAQGQWENEAVNLSDSEKEELNKNLQAREEYIIQEAKEIGKDSMERLKLSDRKIQKFNRMVEIDHILDNGDGDIREKEGELKKLAIEYRNDEDIKKLQTKFYMKTNNYDAAKAVAKSLVKKDDSIENKILLTDIYAEEARRSLNSIDSSFDTDFEAGEKDKEIAAINKEIKASYERLELIDNMEEDVKDEDKKLQLQKLREKERMTLTELSNKKAVVSVKRSINYLMASKPIVGEEKLLYNLQMAKLYFAQDDNDTAKKYLTSALKDAHKYRSSSETMALLSDIQSMYNENVNLDGNVEIVKKADELIRSMTEGYIPMEEESLNSEYRNFLVSYLKYNKMDVYISKLDASNYPEITAYVNVANEKEGLFGQKLKLSKKDFYVEDTDSEIKDFQLINKEIHKVNIAMVFDKSGSMEGKAMQDSKKAGINFVDNLRENQNLSIVTFDRVAQVASGLSQDKEGLKGSIYNIEAEGGTNISAGLKVGIEQVSGEKGLKAVLLLSDGRDNETLELERVIKEAQDEDIAVYTVGFGDIDEDYLRNIAESTGGIFFRAQNSTELFDIYQLLQRYILNNYLIKYEVNQNVDIRERNLIVALKDMNAQDIKQYSIGSAEEENTEEDLGPYAEEYNNSFLLTSVVNGAISSSDLNKDIYIEIKGSKIEEGLKIKIGNKSCLEVKVLSDTKVKVKLPKGLTEGDYDVVGINKEGTVSKLNEAFSIYKPGSMEEITVGNLNIKANNIKKEGSGKITARGNIIINDLIRTNGKMDVAALDPVEGTSNKWNYGDIKGNSTLYLSFNNKDSFVRKIINYAQVNISEGEYFIEANTSDTVLTEIGYRSLNIGLAEIEAKSIQIGTDGLDVSIGKIGFIDTIADKYMRKLPISSGEAKFRMNAEDIFIKFKAEFNLADNFKLPKVLSALKPASFTVNIDTISEEKALEFSGKAELPLFRGTDGFEFAYKAYSENLLLPEEITLKLTIPEIALDPSRLIYLKALGGGVGGMHNLVDGGKWQKLEVIGIADLGVGLGALPIPIIGEIDIMELSDITAKVRLDFSKLDFSGTLKILEVEMAQAGAVFDIEEGFEAKGSAEINLDLLLASFGSKGEFKISIGNDGLIAKSDSEAYFDTAFTDKVSGAGRSKFTFSKDITTFTIYVGLNDNSKGVRIAIDNKGNILNLLKRIQVEVL